VVLEPFYITQLALEGDKYVTNSLIPYHIATIRFHLNELINSKSCSAEIITLADLMLKNLNKHWGCGETGTVVHENEKLGERKRKKGLPKWTLLAACLDPRTKDLDGIPAEEHDSLWKLLQEELIKANSINMSLGTIQDNVMTNNESLGELISIYITVSLLTLDQCIEFNR